MGRIVKIERHNQVTIKTHDAVTIAPSGSNQSAYIDTDGFDKIALTFANDAATSSTIQYVWSHDGVTANSWESLNASSTQYRQSVVDTKSRYVRIYISNGDVASHVINSWLYLKA